MFDVYWTDPDRELVGERRARMDLVKEQRDQGDHVDQKPLDRDDTCSTRSIRSSDSISDKSFSFLGSRSLRKVISSKRSKSPTPTLLSSESSKPSASIRSRDRPSSLATGISELEAIPVDFLQQIYFPTPPSAAAIAILATPDLPPSPSSQESVFSKSTAPSLVTSVSTSGSSLAESTTKSSIVQALGPSSFITRSTEITISPRTPELDVSFSISEVTISSDGQMEVSLTPPHSPSEILPRSDTPIRLIPHTATLTLPPSPSWASSFKPNNPDAWRPPDDWDCSPSPESRVGNLDRSPRPRPISMLPDPDHRLEEMREALRQMAITSPRDIVSRLKAIMAMSSDPQLLRQFEMEQKIWVLSCLNNLDPATDNGLANLSCGPLPITGPVKKILALYETKATASFLATIYSGKEVYHLSTTPLSPGVFPNVHPLFVPTVSPASFPVAPRLFESVYSLSLPSLCPSPEIPAILRNIHRTLAPGGTFHLTIIDPTPCPATMGPHMRAWLDERLLLNLERRFRCVHPSKLFPIWLADACLRGEGSTITTAKFAAVSPELDIDHHSMMDDPTLIAKVARAELRTIVGRMLWCEVWGPVVKTDKWWWEDQDCVDECRELGTFWEYALIEAVRDDIHDD